MRLLLPLIVLELLQLKALDAGQTITMNPDKRLQAKIACDSMNRLSVTNDRITQVFGDNDAYEVQTEENTGQVFLKPTAENGKKPLSITLVTENGLTQDMTLHPEEREATTVILKNPSGSSANTSGETMIDATGGLGAFPSSHSPLRQNTSSLLRHKGGNDYAYGMQAPNFGVALGFQDQVIQAMKYLVAGSAPLMDIDRVSRKGPQSVSVDLMGAFNLGNFKGLKLEVKNLSETSIDIFEKDFLQNADLALAFEKRVLQPKEKTLLYVVVRS